MWQARLDRLRELESGCARKAPPAPLAVDPMTPRPLPDLPAILQRKITARWKEWEPWVWMDLLQRGIDPLGSSEIASLCQQHSRHIVDFMRTGLTMRLIPQAPAGRSADHGRAAQSAVVGRHGTV